eukprot:scaffold93605_cov42-Phaeocystis_antarctica.AAC.1
MLACASLWTAVCGLDGVWPCGGVWPREMKKAAAAPCAVGGGTNGDAPESAPTSSAAITPSTTPVRTSRNDSSADAAHLVVDPRRWVRQSGLVTPPLVGAPREPMRAECGARHRCGVSAVAEE